MGNNVNNEKPIIKIGGNSDIYYEEPGKFGESIRKADYINAFHIVKKFVRNLKNTTNERTGTDSRNKEQVYNIVFFTGERGVGKTSVMLSFMEFLKDYYRKANKNNDSGLEEEFQFKTLKGALDSKYMFTGIDYIDASSLNTKDDILGSVLSNMLTKWKKEEWSSNLNSGIIRGSNYEHKKRKLRMCFNNVYERLKDLRSTKDMTENDSDMFLETLEHLSLSWNLKMSLKELIDTYLDIMVYPNSERDIEKNNHFLVISIDDLDMNINYGFMLLEQIRKYLMIPNVIVLLSANYEQLEKICCNHYSKEFDKLEKTAYNKDYIVKLAREYLEKMVPKQNQVNLLSGYKWKYFAEDEIRIEYIEPDNKKDPIEGTLCKIVSDQINDYFNITFGKNGLCIAYLTPDTLREIVSWVIQIYSLEKPAGENKLEMYKSNMKYFWEEIFHSLCKKYLSIERQNIFETLEMLEPKQQVNSIIRELRIMILKHLESIGKKEENSNNVLNREFFYLLSYVFKTDKQSQAFVVMCLIYFTIKLTQLKIELELSRTDELRKNISKRILCYYSVGRWGILGTWEEKILPSISIIDKEDSDYKKIAAEISSEQAFLEFKLHNILTYTEYENEKGKYIGELKNIQYILLFYKIHVLNTDDNLWKLKENSQKELRLNKNYRGTFSILGFVLNILNGTQIIENFVNSVCDILVSKDKGDDSNREKIKEEISIIPELEKYSNKLLLPINDMEFVKYLGETLSVEIRKKSYVRNIKIIFIDCFTIVEKCLNDYFKDGRTDYSTRFSEFPLVKKIIGDKTNDKMEFFELLEKTISKHLKEDDFLDDEEWDLGV